MQSPVLRSLRDANEADPSDSVPVPHGDALLDRIAANFCLAIRPLFTGSGPVTDPLLIATLHDPRTGAMGLRCWDRELRDSDLPLDRDRRRDQHIIRTTAILIELLVARWPKPVRPNRIGILTDGTGVAIAAAEPCPIEPGWIDRRLADPRGLTALKRFAPDGGLAVLQAPRMARAASH